MKKITMMAACFALLLSSCVTNEESTSVTNIRDAKAEHLKSLATLNNAEAAAAKTLADAEAAYKAAEAELKKADAELKKAEAAKLAADAENEKLLAEAEAALLKAQAALEAAKAAKEEAEAAKIAEEVEKAKLEYEALKAEYAARIAAAEQAKAEAEKAKADALAAMELAKVTAEKALIDAQKELAESKQDLKEKLEEIEADNAVTVEALYNEYITAINNLNDSKQNVTAVKSFVEFYKSGLLSNEEALAALLESYESDIEEYVNTIALAEAKIATLNEYKTVAPEEVRAALVEANAAAYAAEQVKLAAAEVVTDMAVDTKLVGSSSVNGEYGLWDTKWGVYSYPDMYANQYLYSVIYALYQTNLLYMDWDTGDKTFTVYLDENGKEVEEDTEGATAWLAVKIHELDENGEYTDEVMTYPLFTVAPTYAFDESGYQTNYFEYTLPTDTYLFPTNYKVYYNQIVSVGAINKESFEGLVAVVNDCVERMQAMESADTEAIEAIKALVEDVLAAAQAVEAAQTAYDAAVVDVTEDSVFDEELYSWMPTTLGKYNDAVDAEADAKGAYESVNNQLEDMKTVLANLEKKETRWALEDAIEPLKAPVAETAKALKAAQDTLAVKEKALVAAQTAQKKAAADLEAKEIAERSAKKAWEAAAAVVTEAGDKATDAQKKAEKDAKDAYDKAVDATIKANTALAEANAAVVTAEADVEAAETDVETAQAAADAAAAALKAAEDALANLDANIAQLKKEIGWAEEDLAPLKAAYDAAVKAVEEAEAALEAAKALVPELKAVLDAGDLQRAYTVAVAAVKTYVDNNPDFFAGNTIYYTVTNTRRKTEVEAAEAALNSIGNMTTGYAATLDGAVETIQEYYTAAAEALVEAEAEAAEFNGLAKAYAEAVVAFALADAEYTVVSGEVTALNDLLTELTDPDSVLAKIEGLEAEIETAKAAIEAIEDNIEAAKAAVESYEELVAYWESQLASVEAHLALCEALLAEAKAEFDAAVEAATKAE